MSTIDGLSSLDASGGRIQTNTGVLTLPSGTDTLVARASTDTLTNKTLTSPVIDNITTSGSALTLPKCEITISDTSTARKLVLYDVNGGNNFQFAGMGMSTNVFNFRIPDSSHQFGWSYAASSSSHFNLLQLSSTGATFSVPIVGLTGKLNAASTLEASSTDGALRTSGGVCAIKSILTNTTFKSLGTSNQINIQPGGSGNALIFTCTNPATTDRTITFPDPGTDTSIPYLGTAQTFSAINTFSNTTDASSTSTGSIVTSGGIGCAKKLYVGTGVYFGSTNTAINVASGTLNTSQCTSMSTTPIQLIAAPGAGLGIMIVSAFLNKIHAGSAFAGGGNIKIQYGNTAAAGGISATNDSTRVAAATLMTTAATRYVNAVGINITAELATNPNTAVYISNAVGDFTGGGTSSLVYVIHYLVVPMT